MRVNREKHARTRAHIQTRVVLSAVVSCRKEKKKKFCPDGRAMKRADAPDCRWLVAECPGEPLV